MLYATRGGSTVNLVNKAVRVTGGQKGDWGGVLDTGLQSADLTRFYIQYRYWNR